MEFYKELGCWHHNGKIVPNWTPNDVRIKKKEDKMLDEVKKKVIVDQLTEKLEDLKSEKNCIVHKMAKLGHQLYQTLEKCENINDVLDSMNTEKDEE